MTMQQSTMTIYRMAIALSCALLTGGCAMYTVNDQPSLNRTQLEPVTTEHSSALVCLGDLIDQSGKQALKVYVQPIPDKTVPTRFEKRRLSLGGAWWLHTAIDRISSDRVISLTNRPKHRKGENIIEISGAWTQDDMEVGNGSAEISGLGIGKRLSEFFLGAQRRIDVIAGDFLTVRDGQVKHATAISLAVDSRRAGFGMRIQDGSRDYAIDLAEGANEGPQFAQRRIAEAAILAHIGNAFDINYRPCIEAGWVNPAKHQLKIRNYLSLTQKERNLAIQKALVEVGYELGKPDGIWGQQSSFALMSFQSDRGLPITGHPSVPVYATLLQQGSGSFK